MNNIKNNDLNIVAPLEAKLLSKLSHKRIVLRVKKIEEIEQLNETLSNMKLQLGDILLETDLPLSELKFSEAALEHPIIVYSEQFGDYLEFSKHLKTYKDAKIKFFLSSGNQENYMSVKRLSSVGIKSGIYFTDKVYWDELSDLLTYDTYTKTQHQKIEPFLYIHKHFKKGENLDFNIVFLNSPLQFIHVNRDEDFAVSKEDLDSGNFIFKGVDGLDEDRHEQIHNNYMLKLQDFFIHREKCSFCKAWKLCLGKFKIECKESDKPKEFFDEVYEAILFRQNELK